MKIYPSKIETTIEVLDNDIYRCKCCHRIVAFIQKSTVPRTKINYVWWLSNLEERHMKQFDQTDSSDIRIRKHYIRISSQVSHGIREKS